MFNYPIGNNGGKKKPMAKPMEQGMGAAVQEPPMEDGEQDGSAVAEQHGPAHAVNIEHEHEMGSHHVHSVHPDGHEHHSDHGSAEEAHEHGKKLAGVGAQEPESGGEEESEPWGKE